MNLSILFCISSVILVINGSAINKSNSSQVNHDNMGIKKIAVPINTPADFHNALHSYLDKAKPLALLLDFDGTLAPLTSNPDAAEMPEKSREYLTEFSKNSKIFLAAISGRGLADIKSKINLNITYGGNHGIEIENVDGTRSDFTLPKEIQDHYHQLVDELNEKVAKNKAWVEDKRVSLTYHYRGTPENLQDIQKDEASKIIVKYGFKANQAHFAIEAKPPVNWNKGEAANFILKKNFGEDWPKKINVIFCGDDTTDEDAMRILQGHGKTFRISSDPNFETFADFRLPNQSFTQELLKYIHDNYVK